MKTNGICLKNRIWIAAGALLFLWFCLFALRNSVVSAVALEQTARCGMWEHTHNSACYTGNRLTCIQPQHTHTENCYLVLLRDNDINNLLAQVDADESNNLETVISDTVDTATQLSEASAESMQDASDVQAVLLGSTTDEADTQDTSQLDVSALNAVISENDIGSGLILNENLYKATGGTPTDLVLPEDTATLLATGDGGVATLSVGDSASTGNNNANFYVYLDNRWTCFGKLTFTTSGSFFQYTARLTTGNVVNLVNNRVLHLLAWMTWK